MDEIIQIKCPFDGAVLSVRNQPGIDTKNVTCPICKHKYPFSRFRRVTSASSAADPGTQYPQSEEPTSYGAGINTAPEVNLTLGKVTVIGTGVSFQLRPGRNIIGRKAQKSDANFQIDTGENRAMSREHIVIEVKKVPLKGFVHYVSLYKEKVNTTLVGNDPLLYGDCLVLNHGDRIRLPDATLRFDIPDGEETDL